jgi:two-component system, chemotaxis family, sensor kinase CheA
MDMSDFYSTFFQEADELLTDMENYLLDLDLDDPDSEQVNAIFRAAHSIKGGAGTFGFDLLQQTTHILENLLDHARQDELTLTKEIVDLFLKTKDVLMDQIEAYRSETTPEQDTYEEICHLLDEVGKNEVGKNGDANGTGDASAGPASEPQGGCLAVHFKGVGEDDVQSLVDELENLGDISSQGKKDDYYEVVLETSVTADDIEAVMCFILDAEQIEIHPVSAAAEPEDSSEVEDSQDDALAAAGIELFSAEADKKTEPVKQDAEQTVKAEKAEKGKKAKKPAESENSSLRVAVDKIDQVINLVGELIITQSMLNETASTLDRSENDALLNGINLLQRNARDLQDAVMSIRMLPMDYVFSRFPRLVRDLAGRLNKEIELVTVGESTELDKGLTERIIDPLTHLVRNSLDHGIEAPDAREAAGKPRQGKLTLSAQHQGGNILIEVSDDGAGLDRDKLLSKARSNGLTVSDTMTDDEVWQLIFAPGFSTAEVVSDVSGRGVGMDVVKRNIQAMGGHVEIVSKTGQGTTTKIILPLTLAILDGMSVKVGSEVYILPVSSVVESLQLREENLYTLPGGVPLLKVRGEYFPVALVSKAMGIESTNKEIVGSIAVMVEGGGRRYALLVDELVGQQQVVVKNVESNYRKIPGVSAATILGNGSVAFILDLADIYNIYFSESEISEIVAENIEEPELLTA